MECIAAAAAAAASAAVKREREQSATTRRKRRESRHQNPHLPAAAKPGTVVRGTESRLCPSPSPPAAQYGLLRLETVASGCHFQGPGGWGGEIGFQTVLLLHQCLLMMKGGGRRRQGAACVRRHLPQTTYQPRPPQDRGELKGGGES